MKIYTVEHGYDYEGCDLRAIFTERPEAERYVEDAKFGDFTVLREWDIVAGDVVENPAAYTTTYRTRR